jgi:hypothetical protein
MKLFNAETMRKDLVGKVRKVRIYNGTAQRNLTETTTSVAHEETIKVTNEKWLNSAGRETLLRDRKNLQTKLEQQKNAATGYDRATIAALTTLYTIDLVRQQDEYPDYAAVLLKEIVNEEATDPVNLLDQMPYIGKEEELKGSGDTVPLMEHALPNKYPVELQIRGFGDKTTLRELIFNPFHKTEKLITSASRILSDHKNKDLFGDIFGIAYDSAHSQAADTAGATYDIQLYNTLKKGIRKAVNLLCEPLGKANGEYKHEIYLLVNPLDLIDIQPIANGALAGVGGLQQFTPALPIAGIIPYGCGLNHGFTYGKEALSYPGVPQGKAYAFVKVDTFGGYRIIKRNETMDIGEGDVLSLSSEHRAWHRIRGVFTDWVKPVSKGNKAYGAVVEITLPTFG